MSKTAYFKKELPFHPFRLPDNTHAKVEPVAGNLGVYSTDNADYIKAIETAISQQRSGWYAVTEAEFKSLVEKKTPLKHFSRREELSASSMRKGTRPVPAPPKTAVAAAPERSITPPPEGAIPRPTAKPAE